MLFEGGFLPFSWNIPRTYDVAPDGKFLMIQPTSSTRSPSLILVKNWVEELKARVPTK
jgi:hypothetical protein